MRAPLIAVIALASWFVPTRSSAWILHEHWAIARHGVEHQSPERLKEMEALWARIALRHPGRFCADPVGTGKGLAAGKGCVDFAVLSALAGDHSCSPPELWRYARDEPWVIDVLEVARGVALDLQKTTKPTEMNDIWDLSHLRLESADAEYSTRAGENTAHFLAGRVAGELDIYVKATLGGGARSNALAIYVYYHLAALRLALDSFELGKTDRDGSDKLLERALVTEAYAQHFLEDMYSSGHIVSSWGDVATRKGTHDHYSAEGMDAHTWGGQVYSARGDAHMREEDLKRAGGAITDSLKQVLEAAAGDPTITGVLAPLNRKTAEEFEAFDTCQASFMPRQVPTDDQLLLVQPILVQTIMPGREEGDGAYPRFRAELGPFVRLYAALSGGAAFAGYQTDQIGLAGSPRGRASLSMGGAVGLGLEGVTGRSGDGAAFLQAAFTMDTSQQDGPCGDCSTEVDKVWHRDGNSVAPRVPSRAGLELRLRMPYWLLPGDLILGGAVLLWAAPMTYKAMALRAVRGGLIPWQRTNLTSIGTFQFMVGREVGVTMRGVVNRDTYVYQIDDPGGTGTRLNPVEFGAVELDLPVLEYRPYRDFQTRVTNAVLMQLGFAAEFITDAAYARADLGGTPIAPPSGTPSMGNSYYVYLRVAFDGRVYF
jgi:hypothetical protein